MTLISLILAHQELERHPGKWLDTWKKPAITMEKLVVFGVDENDDTVNTMDTCKPRSLADVLYRSELFKDLGTKERLQVARICDYAVRMLWHRTAAGVNAFAPRRTHSEALDFIARHPHVLDCVRHIFSEYSGTPKMSALMSPGYAAGLLYLMAAAQTDPSKYRESDAPSEANVDWSLWDKACDYWVLLIKGATELALVRSGLAGLASDDDEVTLSIAERCGLIVKGWNCSIADQTITAKRIELEYDTDEDGVRTLAEIPTVGGIDLGSPDEAEPVVADEGDAGEDQPANKPGPKPKRKRGTRPAPPKVAKRKDESWTKGDTAWIRDSHGESYFGELSEDPYTTDDGQLRVMVQAGDQQWDVAVDELRLEA